MKIVFFIKKILYLIRRVTVYRSVTIDLKMFFKDHSYLKKMLIFNKSETIKSLKLKYNLLPGSFVENYINHIIADHLENPQASLYIESELGAPQRQVNLINDLGRIGYSVKKKKCLDIGCSNGALVLACFKAGASDVLGIDVEERRLEKARALCRDTEIRLNKFNILDQSMEEKFDVILSTDVLEHVSDPEKIFFQIQYHLEKNKNAFAYLSLFNKFQPDNVLAEPHYNIPGMILMPFDEAKEFWYKIRKDYKSNLEYEVAHWHSYWEYKQMAEKYKLEMIPLQDDVTVRKHSNVIKNYKNIITKIKEDYKTKMEKSPIQLKYRNKIEEYINKYIEEFLLDHSRLEKEQTDEIINFLFFKYYAQPIMFILKHKISL